jgi:hypothetical protein
MCSLNLQAILFIIVMDQTNIAPHLVMTITQCAILLADKIEDIKWQTEKLITMSA